AGFQVKNHMSSLDPEQRDAVELLVRKGGGVAVATAPKPVIAAIPTIPTPVPVLPSRTVRRESEPAKPAVTPPPIPATPVPEPHTKLAPVAAAKAPELPARVETPVKSETPRPSEVAPRVPELSAKPPMSAAGK